MRRYIELEDKLSVDVEKRIVRPPPPPPPAPFYLSPPSSPLTPSYPLSIHSLPSTDVEKRIVRLPHSSLPPPRAAPLSISLLISLHVDKKWIVCLPLCGAHCGCCGSCCVCLWAVLCLTPFTDRHRTHSPLPQHPRHATRPAPTAFFQVEAYVQHPNALININLDDR